MRRVATPPVLATARKIRERDTRALGTTAAVRRTIWSVSNEPCSSTKVEASIVTSVSFSAVT